MNAKGASGELSQRNEEHVMGHWRKGHPFHKVSKNTAELCSSVSPLIRNATLSDSKFSYISLCLESLFHYYLCLHQHVMLSQLEKIFLFIFKNLTLMNKNSLSHIR